MTEIQTLLTAMSLRELITGYRAHLSSRELNDVVLAAFGRPPYTDKPHLPTAGTTVQDRDSLEYFQTSFKTHTVFPANDNPEWPLLYLVDAMRLWPHDSETEQLLELTAVNSESGGAMFMVEVDEFTAIAPTIAAGIVALALDELGRTYSD